ncbi:MAG: hypothetical protein A2Y40_00665 [Candidatus Margulisbacteria bacterium GWF2_35_9]|nr:MAG: hypothetical protein A2Y40_00665 [Candidatus Margulisbacteria bacterium GWF2_35_9]
MLNKIIAVDSELDIAIQILNKVQKMRDDIKSKPENIKKNLAIVSQDESLWRDQDMCRAIDSVIRGASADLVKHYNELAKIERTLIQTRMHYDMLKKLIKVTKGTLSQTMNELRSEYKLASDYWGYFDLNREPRRYSYSH